MKIHFNKYEYFLILMVNILLLLCIVFTTQNCKENNRLRISGFHKNAVKDTLKEEHKYDYNQQNIKEKVQKKRYTIRKELTIPIWRVKEIYCSMIAELHITQTGLALLQYKQKQGTFPDSLEKLNLKNTNDPFSDRPLIYKSGGQDFILYSIGPDQKDNNGSPKQDKQEKDFDIVWNFIPAR